MSSISRLNRTWCLAACSLLLLEIASADVVPASTSSPATVLPTSKANDATPSQLKCKLEISTTRQAGVSGSIDLLIQLRNDDSRTISFQSSAYVNDFDFEVTSPDGSPAPLTREGARIMRMKGTRYLSTVMSLDPGMTFVMTLSSLDRIFDLSVAGEYRIRLSRSIFSGAAFASGTIKLISNQTIAVVPLFDQASDCKIIRSGRQ